MQDEVASAAKTYAYLIYVTEICKCSQQSKQNAQGVLRPGDFFDSLGKR